MVEELLDVVTPGWVDAAAPGASGALAFVADSRTFMFGAYVDNEPAGWLWGGHVRRPDGRTLSYVHEVDVVPDFRRRGLATSLIEAAIGLARREGSHRLWLVTRGTNTGAQALYEATGAARDDRGDIVYQWDLR